MAAVTESQREERIAAVLARAGAGQPGVDGVPLDTFSREYFRQVDLEDLDERARGPAGRAAVALAARRAAPAGAPKVRVFSPTPGADGWGSRHTIVQVVNDDMPFLVDSVSLEIARQGLAIHLIVHPIFAVQRDAAACCSRSCRGATPQLPRESWMYIEVDRMVDAQQRAALASGIERVLADVRAAVGDWKAMVARLHGAREELAADRPGASTQEAQESRAFLDWLAGDHFTLLGYQQRLVEQDGSLALRLVEAAGWACCAPATAQSRASPRCRRPRARWRARLRRCW